MGLLSTQQNARAFSSYVTLFGLALLISSIVYLKRLDNSREQHACLADNVKDYNITFAVVPLCSQFNHWRTAAIIGIIIGVIDILILPFLILSCCLCCIACGCAVSVSDCCHNVFDVEASTTSDETRNGDEATTMNNPSKRTNKYEVRDVRDVRVKNEPSKCRKWTNILGWIIWVLSPFLATLYIVTSLYRFEAIRTNNIELFNSALALFVISLFNLMVFFQQFVNSICGYGHEKAVANAKN